METNWPYFSFAETEILMRFNKITPVQRVLFQKVLVALTTVFCDTHPAL